jgi:hypothetical protein
MTERRFRIWAVVAALFTVVNVGGAGYALASGEPPHAAVHVALLVAAYPVWRFVRRSRQLGLVDMRTADARLDHMQQSLDAIAVEVERIGEAQRYAVKILAERERNSPPKPS